MAFQLRKMNMGSDFRFIAEIFTKNTIKFKEEKAHISSANISNFRKSCRCLI